MSNPRDDQPEHTDEDRSAEGGQVSEVSGMGKAGEPVSPGDSVAGQPTGESGATDEGPTGPEAVTYADEQDHYPSPDEDDLSTGPDSDDSRS